MSDKESPHPPPVPRRGLLLSGFQFLVALAITLPVCMLLWPHLPLMQVPVVGGMSLDRLALFVVMLVVLLALLRRLPLLSSGPLLLPIGALTLQGLSGGYRFHVLLH